MSVIDKIDAWANRAGLRWTSSATGVILGGTVSVLTFVTAGGLADPAKVVWSATIALPVGLLTWAFWLYSCRPPKTPKGATGIVIAIATERETERQKLKTELFEYLVEYLEQRPSAVQFKVIDVPSYLIPDVTDVPSALKMCRATRGKLLIWGSVRTRSRGQTETLVIRLEGQVVHRETPLQRSWALSQDMRATIPKTTEIDLGDELNGFEATSQGLAAAAKYVVALAFAVSDEWSESKALLYELERETAVQKSGAAKKRMGKQAAYLGRLRPMVGKRLVEICFADYLTLYQQWMKNRDDLGVLQQAEAKLEEYHEAAVRHATEDPLYWISKALLEVTLRKNLSGAETLLRKCQAVAITDPTWRLSLAFIAILRNQLNAALTHYDTAFGLNPNLEMVFDVEAYVHWWLKKNGGPPALYLLSAMLNVSGKNDLDLARSDMTQFETSYSDPISTAVQRRIDSIKTKIG